jgi:mRNA-degrading endonuclease RelE of RelBE toxin-antitoxin system
MYNYEVKDRLSKKLQKIAKKDSVLYEAIMKKILQVADNPLTGKPLHGKLKGKRRVHIILDILCSFMG